MCRESFANCEQPKNALYIRLVFLCVIILLREDINDKCSEKNAPRKYIELYDMNKLFHKFHSIVVMNIFLCSILLDFGI